MPQPLPVAAKYTNGGGPYPGAPAAAGPEGLWRGAAASAAPGGLARTYGGGGGAGPATLAPFEQFPVAASVGHGRAGEGVAWCGAALLMLPHCHVTESVIEMSFVFYIPFSRNGAF